MRLNFKTVITMFACRWKCFFLVAVVLFASSACGKSELQNAKCDQLAVAGTSVTVPEHELDYKALNSTSLNAEVAKLYGVEQDETLGVVMVSVYQSEEHGIGVETCVSGSATNLIGQINQLEFEEIREGAAIYHISTFRFTHKEPMTFRVDVAIVASGETHKLKWNQKFWRG